MARLQRGENPKMDHINDLVVIVKDDNSSDREKIDAMSELLVMFKPMMIKVCDKWCKYFNDTAHKIVPFEDLLADANQWFIIYTKDKYTIDGDATYNKFITDHINQRVRYIYETHLRYWSRHILPDPIKNQESESSDELETVIYNYSSEIANQTNMDDDYADRELAEFRANLAHRINELIEIGNYNEREKKLWNKVMIEGVTQEAMAKELGISRMRLVQILRKIRQKIKRDMENDTVFWELINKTDIDFDTIHW